MTSFNHIPKNREELEIRITDAIDGELSPKEREQLEKELQVYPGLWEDYKAMMNLPGVSGIYGTIDSHRSDIHVYRIREAIGNMREGSPFVDISLAWFRKYALVASLLVLALSSAVYFAQSDMMNGDTYPEDLYYSLNESSADDYVTYLNEWIDE